jgi:hypothetical protein
MVKKKNKRPRKPKPPFRSILEEELAPLLGGVAAYEQEKIPYTVRHDSKYNADWTPGEKYIYETKGYFRTQTDANKYLYIRSALEVEGRGRELIFILESNKTKMPGKKKPRKDGTFYTIANWCDKHGFKWCTKKDTKQIKKWRKEDVV